MAPEAFFLPVASGRRFCLFYPALGGNERGAVLYLHPFAEEMNKSRRMAALQTRLLASHGYSILQIDLHGCGDSSGDFGEASWQSWLRDIHDAHAWLRGRSSAQLWLWGLRASCLLASQAAASLNDKVNFLFWQPAVSGKLFLQQFLRLKLAGDLLAGDGKGAMETMRSDLANGKSVEVAGYTLAPSLAHPLEQAECNPPAREGRLVWMEINARSDATLMPVSLKYLSRWESAGYATQAQVVSGPAFWQTTEIEESPALLDATVAALTRDTP